jgi:hypothetical protein
MQCIAHGSPWCKAYPDFLIQFDKVCAAAHQRCAPVYAVAAASWFELQEFLVVQPLQAARLHPLSIH